MNYGWTIVTNVNENFEFDIQGNKFKYNELRVY